jgi:murein L,D-transpeptidase YcbB/YkuD
MAIVTRRQLALVAFAALAACGRAPEPAGNPQPKPATAGTGSYARVPVGRDIAAFYARRGNRPLWVGRSGLRPEAEQALKLIAGARFDGLDPANYGWPELARAADLARTGDAGARAHLELLLSRGFAGYVRDLRSPRRNPMVLAEPGLAPEPPSPTEVLQALAEAPSPHEGLSKAVAMNPLYAGLRRGYARWAAAGGRGDERLVRANLDRARAIPASAGRYIVVDTASARLWMIDGGRVDGPMRVIVGKPGMETPMLASRITHAVLNPYWNMPPDLARGRAKRVLREGPELIGRERLQILSDWSDTARPIPASAVNWKAVAAGGESLRLRQLPGGANVMGAMKFMMANRLGIYLHDFPDKALFARSDRRLSSGCVRLSDYRRLAAWLFRGRPPAPRGGAPEQRVDLPEPVPVYITYLTVLPGGPEGLTFQPDSYRRDAPGGGPAPVRAKED